MSLRRLCWGLVGFILACASGNTATTTSPTTSATSAPSSTISLPSLPYLIETDSIAGLPVEIHGPDRLSENPVVVMFHGGGWYGGSPLSMTALAEYLASEGFVVFNATYRTASGGFPDSFDDVSCAVRYAQSRANEFSTSEGAVSVVAHSAGAHLAAVVALAGDVFGSECPVTDSSRIDRFVGIAGPYDPSLYALVLAQYFGTRLEVDPEPWQAGSPYTYLDQNLDLQFLLVHGDSDELVPVSSSELFYQALVQAGYLARLEVMPGASHLDSDDPEAVGELIVEFLTAYPG